MFLDKQSPSRNMYLHPRLCQYAFTCPFTKICHSNPGACPATSTFTSKGTRCGENMNENKTVHFTGRDEGAQKIELWCWSNTSPCEWRTEELHNRRHVYVEHLRRPEGQYLGLRGAWCAQLCSGGVHIVERKV